MPDVRNHKLYNSSLHTLLVIEWRSEKHLRKRTKSEIFLWLSSSAIFLSAVIGIVAVVITTGTLYYVLLIFSIALGGVSAPTAILAGRQTALEQQERFERERQEREQRLKQEEEERKKGFMAAKWATRILVGLMALFTFAYFGAMIQATIAMAKRYVKRQFEKDD